MISEVAKKRVQPRFPLLARTALFSLCMGEEGRGRRAGGPAFVLSPYRVPTTPPILSYSFSIANCSYPYARLSRTLTREAAWAGMSEARKAMDVTASSHTATAVQL